MDTNAIALDDAHEDAVFVRVTGEHDISTAPGLRECLEEALARHRALIVDLSKATFMDSSILGALLEARRQAHEQGTGFVVCLGIDPQAGVRRILEITGLVPVFPVVETQEEALAAARAQPTASDPA